MQAHRLSTDVSSPCPVHPLGALNSLRASRHAVPQQHGRPHGGGCRRRLLLRSVKDKQTEASPQQEQQQQQQEERGSDESPLIRQQLWKQLLGLQQEAQTQTQRARSSRPSLSGVNYINTSLAFLIIRLVLNQESFRTLALFRGLQSADELGSSDVAGVILAIDFAQLAAVSLLARIAAPQGIEGVQGQSLLQNKGPLSTAGVGIAGGLVSYGVVYAVSTILPHQNAKNTGELLSVLQGLDGWPFAACLFSLLVVGPAHEELFFRGFFLQGAAKFMSVPAAVGISAAVFAASHLLPGEFLPLTCLGLTLASTSITSGSVVSAIIAHAIYNGLVLYTAFQQLV